MSCVGLCSSPQGAQGDGGSTGSSQGAGRKGSIRRHISEEQNKLDVGMEEGRGEEICKFVCVRNKPEVRTAHS